MRKEKGEGRRQKMNTEGFLTKLLKTWINKNIKANKRREIC